MLILVGGLIVFLSTIGGFMIAGGNPIVLLHVSEFVVILGVEGDKVAVVAATNDEARARGVSANDLVRAVGGLLGGKGGGKDDVAQGGGTDVTKVEEALALLKGFNMPFMQ